MIRYRTPAVDWSKADRALGLPSNEGIIDIARAVDQARRAPINNTPWGSVHDPRLLGWYGTRALARYLNVPMDASVRAYGGDRRVNLIGPCGVKIDVITRTPPRYDKLPDLTLRCSMSERHDLALALVIWHGLEYEPEMGGWLWESDLRQMNRRQTLVSGENGGESFLASVSSLRPMVELTVMRPRANVASPMQGVLL